MDELRWRKEPPDSPGIWAIRSPDMVSPDVIWVPNHEAYVMNETETCCKLMDLPTILPPKSKVTYRLWVVKWVSQHNSGWTNIWAKEGVDMFSRYPVCSKTDVTEEREE